LQWRPSPKCSAECKPNLMLWSAVRIFLRSQMLHGFLTCTESSKEVSTGDPPHKAVLVDDRYYERMFFPKGAIRTCIANIWHCKHDRAISGETLMTSDQKGILISGAMSYLALPQRDELGGLSSDYVTYGFGRRIGVGKHLAE
jgi:hypothetical protein